MKKFLSVLIALLLISSTAFARIPSLPDSAFSRAKDALTGIAAGEFENVTSGLPFSGSVPDTNAWASVAASLSTNTPQTKYAVAYWTGNVWKIVVPVSEPSSGKVQCFYLTTADCSAFNGYGLTSWEKASAEYKSADYVVWKNEYFDTSAAMVEADD